MCIRDSIYTRRHHSSKPRHPVSVIVQLANVCKRCWFLNSLQGLVLTPIVYASSHRIAKSGGKEALWESLSSFESVSSGIRFRSTASEPLEDLRGGCAARLVSIHHLPGGVTMKLQTSWRVRTTQTLCLVRSTMYAYLALCVAFRIWSCSCWLMMADLYPRNRPPRYYIP